MTSPHEHAEPSTAPVWRYEYKYRPPEPLAQLRALLSCHPAMFDQAFDDRWVNSIYFDTDDLQHFRDGLKGLPRRSKVRVRWYGDLSGQAADPHLELKVRHGPTGIKHRVSLAPFALEPDGLKAAVVRSLHQAQVPPALHVGLFALRPQVLVRYRRSYLVSRDGAHRLTLDSALHTSPVGARLGFTEGEPTPTIVELKFDADHLAKTGALLATLPFRAVGFSKYAFAVRRAFGT